MCGNFGGTDGMDGCNKGNGSDDMAGKQSCDFGGFCDEKGGEFGNMAVEQGGKFCDVAMEKGGEFGNMAVKQGGKFGVVAMEKGGDIGDMAVSAGGKFGVVSVEVNGKSRKVARDRVVKMVEIDAAIAAKFFTAVTNRVLTFGDATLTAV